MQKFLDTQLSADEKIKFIATVAKLRDTPSGIKGETNQKYISEMANVIAKYKNLKVNEIMEGENVNVEIAKEKAKKISENVWGFGAKGAKTRKQKTFPFGVLQINLDKFDNNQLKLTYKLM